MTDLKGINLERPELKGWTGYKAKHKRRYTFEDLGCPDFWVDLELFTSRPWLEIKEMGTTARRLQTLDESEAIPEDMIDILDQQLTTAILGWNLTHPETNDPLPVPSEDPTSLDVLPNDFIFLMQGWFQEQFGEAVPFQRGG